MNQIILFASGSGTNAENIIKYFQKSSTAEVAAVYCNNPNAGVIDRANRLGVPVTVFDKSSLESTVFDSIRQADPALIVLAGFLLKLPHKFVQVFPRRIINIHPALLPKYGGKGMYGLHVHRKVLENQEDESGISIHYVNENYDEGDIILSKSVSIADCQSAEEIAARVQDLEYKFYPVTIEQLLRTKP